MVSVPESRKYRVQRYYPKLEIGASLAVKGRRQTLVPVHLRQSEADSACGLHCVAMALIVLDLVKRSAVLSMTHRKYGVAADLYAALGKSWHQGAYACDIVEALEALTLPVSVKWTDGFGRGVDAFAVSSLSKVQLTLIAYESARDRHRHFVLGVGCAGYMLNQRLSVDSLLVLDPSADALPFSCCNGILSVDKAVSFEARRSPVQWQYASGGQTEPVRLMSAISISSPSNRAG